jgi:hypothetical protein
MLNVLHDNEYITIPDEIKKYSEFFNLNNDDFIDESYYILFYGTKKDIQLCIEYLSIPNKTIFQLNTENYMPVIPNKPIQDFLSKEELNWLKSIQDIELENLMIFTDYIMFHNLLYLTCYYHVNKKYLLK